MLLVECVGLIVCRLTMAFNQSPRTILVICAKCICGLLIYKCVDFVCLRVWYQIQSSCKQITWNIAGSLKDLFPINDNNFWNLSWVSAVGTGWSLMNSYWHCCCNSAAVTFDAFLLDLSVDFFWKLRDMLWIYVSTSFGFKVGHKRPNYGSPDPI